MSASRVNVGRLRLSVTEAGDGEPVILLHGFPETSYSWRHQLPALAQAGYRALAPDLCGYGKSDRPPAVREYAITQLVGDIVGLIGALEYESAHIVGHDWGGGIAWALAGARPELVRSLTILNAPQGPVSARVRREDPEQQARSWYMLLFQFVGVAEAWLSGDDFRNLRRFVFEDAAPGTFTEDDQRAVLDAFAKDGSLTAALNYYRANMPPAALLREPPEPPEITVPTMIIWGEGDSNMSPRLLEESAATVSGPLRVERLPGISHWVQQEAPDAVNALLVDFLNGQRAAGN